MAHRSVRDCRPLSKPLAPFFPVAPDLAGLEGLRKPMVARLDYREIRLRREDWEELLDVVRAQRAILKIVETAGCDPNSGARELLRMSLERYQDLLSRLMRQSGNGSF